MDKYVTFFTNGKGQEFEKPEHLKAIRQSLVWLIADPECNQAFKDANLPLPGDVIKKRGLRLAGAGVLLDPSVDSAIGINETIRQAAVKHVENLATQAFTIDVNGGRLYTFFKNSAFSGSSWLWGTYALEEIVVHENIHVAGQPGDDKASGHDLSTFKALFKHHKQMQDRQMNDRKLQIAFAITVSLINIYLAGLYSGYENGYSQTMNTYKSLIGFKISEGTAYGPLAASHFAIFLCIGGFIVFKLVSQRIVFQLLAGLACILALWKSIYWGWTLKYIGEGYTDSFYDLIRETVFLGWISALLIVLLTIFHLVSISRIKKIG